MNTIIPMPSEAEKRKSIASIVDEGMQSREHFAARLRRLTRTVGLRYTFFGVGDAVIVAALLSLLIFIVLAVAVFAEGRSGALHFVYLANTTGSADAANATYLWLAFFSPTIYFSMYTFTLWKERLMRTYSIIASCRYDIRHLTALRLIVISAVSLIFVIAASLSIGGIAGEGPGSAGISILTMVGVSVSALLLYGVLTLTTLLFPAWRVSGLSAPGVWLVLCGITQLTIHLHGSGRPVLLSDIPAAAYYAVATVLLIIYLLEFRLFLLQNRRISRSPAVVI